MSSSIKRRTPQWRGLVIAAIVVAAAMAINPEVAATSATDGYFPASVLSQPIPAGAALAPNSDRLVQELRNQAFGVGPDVAFDCRHSLYVQPARWTAEERRWCHRVNYLPDINDEAYAPTLFTVGGGQPTVKVTLDINNPSMNAAVAAVPIPDGAAPAPGTDGQMIIWQPSSDTMWEFWRARLETDGWHAGGAGRIMDVAHDPGHYTDVPNVDHRCSNDPAVAWCEQHSWGGPSSRIPNLTGLMTLAQLESGHIDHALAFALPNNLQNSWAWPAQSTDGVGNSRIPQGARFRIDPNLDLDAWFASLKNPNGSPRPVPPMLRMMAEAAQTYGIVLVNTSPGVTFYGENWHDGGTDIYDNPGGLFGGLKPWQFMVDFPWEHMQALREDMCSGPAVASESLAPCPQQAAVTVPLDRLNTACKPPVPTSPQSGDVSGPFVTVTTPASGSVVGRPTFSAFASDPSGVARVEFFVDGDLRYTSNYPHCAMNRMQYTYGGLAGWWDTNSESPGTHLLLVRAVDTLGNASTSEVTVQTGTSPTPVGGTPPAPVVTNPASPLQLHRSFVGGWEASGAITSGYDVNVREATFGQPFGPSRRWLSAVTDLRRKYASARPGSTYCISARASSVGVPSPWSAERCTAVPLDDRALVARHRPWSRRTAHGYYLGTSTVTSVRGAELARTGVLAKRITLIGTKCRTCGAVQIYWNGAPLRRVSFASKRLRRRVKFDVANFLGRRSGTLVIKVVSAGRPVRIDGLGVSQS